jgi:hypothetical protein
MVWLRQSIGGWVENVAVRLAPDLDLHQGFDGLAI